MAVYNSDTQMFLTDMLMSLGVSLSDPSMYIKSLEELTMTICPYYLLVFQFTFQGTQFMASLKGTGYTIYDLATGDVVYTNDLVEPITDDSQAKEVIVDTFVFDWQLYN